MNVRDKVVLVTGASAGIGAATARRFAREGAKLALAARSTDALEAVAAEVRGLGGDAAAIAGDVSSKAEVERVVAETVARFGRLDVLINNAGRAVWGPVSVLNIDDYRTVLELNLFGALYGMQAAVPKMREAGGGVIVNVSSMVSKMNLPNLAGYASTKYALNALSHAARLELAGDNIRVVVVYPGRTATDFSKHTLGSDGAHARAGGPRPDTAEQVADVILAATERAPRDAYMNLGSRLFALASTLAPALVDAAVARGMRRAQSGAPAAE